MLSEALVKEATTFLRSRVVRTPVVASPALSDLLGVPVWLKLECHQVTGSFKVRGAFFALHRLSAQSSARVVTCSAGNHGLGLAYAAHSLGIPVTVYVPRTVDPVKAAAIEALGATLVRSPFDGFDDSERWTMEQAGGDYISAYDDDGVMAGNGGSLAEEILEQLPEARTFVVPVGGGGMAAGLSFVVKERVAGARVIAAQLDRSAALKLSLERGAPVTRLPGIETLAGGLEGGMGARPFAVLKDRVDHVVTASEDEVWDGVRWMIDQHQTLIEASSAVAIAATRSAEFEPSGPVVIVISGRNISRAALRRILTSNPTTSETPGR